METKVSESSTGVYTVEQRFGNWNPERHWETGNHTEFRVYLWTVIENLERLHGVSGNSCRFSKGSHQAGVSSSNHSGRRTLVRDDGKTESIGPHIRCEALLKKLTSWLPTNILSRWKNWYLGSTTSPPTDRLVTRIQHLEPSISGLFPFDLSLTTNTLELTTENCQLKKREIDQISKFLVEFPEVDRLILFGSRAMGNAKLGSDLDLAVVGAQVDDRIMSKITDSLENKTNLPYLIDLIHFDKIENPNLLEHITQFGKTIYQRKQS